MNFLLVNYEYTVSGATIALLGLAEHLRRSGHHVTVCAMLPEAAPIKAEYEKRGFDVRDLPVAGYFDFCVCNTIETAPCVIQVAPSAKTLWWLHEGTVGLDLLLAHRHWQPAFGHASAIIFASPFQRDAIFRSFTFALPPSRLLVIPYGPDVVEQRPEITQRAAEVTVVSVGTVYPRKRHEDLIRAVASLPTAIRCIIVGKLCALPPDCVDIAAADPQRFQLLGEQDHAATLDILAAADIFSLSSSDEAFPLSALEAAMLGKAIVLSDLRTYDGVWVEGVNCLKHPVGDAASLAAAIVRLAQQSELKDRLGSAARETALKFSKPACLAAFDAMLGSL